MFTVFTTLLNLAPADTESLEGSCTRPGQAEPPGVYDAARHRPGMTRSAECVLHVTFGYIADFWPRFLSTVRNLSYYFSIYCIVFSISLFSTFLVQIVL